MKSLAKCLAALAVCSALVFGFAACANGSDGTSVVVPNNGTQNGGTGTTTTTTTPTETGGGTTTPAVNPVVYTIILNANDGSPNPATVTQKFTAGVPQGLIPVEELGFSKSGFSFAGWGRASKSTQSLYADGASYTATSNATLYALWSVVPVYSANIASSEHGTFAATPAAAPAGTEITLSATPNEGYELASYTVTAADGTPVAVANGKFTMPAQDVTVSAVFNALNFTVTFNANDGSQSPATATQTFTAGTPQNLKTIAELGFSKSGFNFAGWLASADASEASYADGSSYTGTTDVTLYALWSAIPVYSVNTALNEHGTVAAIPATGKAGTEITLSAVSNAGYELASYTVTTADGTPVTVTNGKFAMPAQDVTVTANFNAISYTVTCGTFSNGRVTASPTTATVGTSVTLIARSASGYQLATLTTIAEDGTSVSVSGTGSIRTFTMPAMNVTVSAKFNAINHTVIVRTSGRGSIVATPATATVGTCVTLTLSPASGYKLNTLTVNTDGGASVALRGTGNTRTFSMPARNVIVTATFATLPTAAYTKIDTTTINGTQYDIVTFGSWPQTVKAANVEVSEQCESKDAGEFTYYKGSDGQWYVKIKETARESDYKYSDGTPVAQSSADSYKWFKVEPIKWRVLTTDYNGTGKKLLLAESILIGKAFDQKNKNNYQNSTIRKWLNSNANSAAASDYSDSGGFLKTAFTADEIVKIAKTIVDNSARSTYPAADDVQFNNAGNKYASDTPTTDKVFLLSKQEATTSAYGFDAWDGYKGDGTHNESTRIRFITDYAMASATPYCKVEGLGSWWWLRSPSDENYFLVNYITCQGGAVYSDYAYHSYGSILPALCVSN